MLRRRREYLNGYALTSAPRAEFNPVGWQVHGCLLQGAQWACELLDERSDALWRGATHTLRFAMNAQAASYQRYRLDFCLLGAQLRCSRRVARSVDR